METRYTVQKNVSSTQMQTLQFQDCAEAIAKGWTIVKKSVMEDIASCTVLKSVSRGAGRKVERGQGGRCGVGREVGCGVVWGGRWGVGREVGCGVVWGGRWGVGRGGRWSVGRGRRWGVVWGRAGGAWTGREGRGLVAQGDSGRRGVGRGDGLTE